MGRSDRPAPTPITGAHFQLLQSFGRSALQRKSRDKDRRKLWALACQSAGLPVIPRDEVIDAWKKYVGGLSEHSSIAINGDIDPNYTTLGVTYRGRITAAHTTKTLSLLRRVIGIFARTFDSREDFLNGAEALSQKTADRIWGKQP